MSMCGMAAKGEGAGFWEIMLNQIQFRGGGGAEGQTKTKEDAAIYTRKRWGGGDEDRRKREIAISILLQTLFLALQADAKADGGELTEDGRKRNERPKIGPWRKGT